MSMESCPPQDSFPIYKFEIPSNAWHFDPLRPSSYLQDLKLLECITSFHSIPVPT